MKNRPTLTYAVAKLKAANYCSFQERSQQEVRDKLYSWGLHQADVELLLSELILEGFLNEERFAIAYARGKHRMNQWGKYKIKQGLKQKSVSEPLVRAALEQLDPNEYRETLRTLLAKKQDSLQEPDAYKRRHRMINYGLGKGYEQDLIIELLSDN